jgi:hypothetical protein
MPGGDGRGTTPLMRAAKGTDVAVMRLLLDAGADPMLTQKDYTNALMIAASGGRAGCRVSGFRVTEEGSIAIARSNMAPISTRSTPAASGRCISPPREARIRLSRSWPNAERGWISE